MAPQKNKHGSGLVVNASADELKDQDFAIPKARRFPIQNKQEAEASLSRVMQYGTQSDIAAVRAAVDTRFPGLADGPTTNADDTEISTDAEGTSHNVHGFVTACMMTANLASVPTYQILEGRKYLVIPTVMITEGVHAGSNGPLYYPAAELAKIPAVWNHKPTVVYHPTANGAPISACEPAVISRRKVGLIMNTKWEPGKKGNPGKLKAEVWLDTERADAVDDRVMKAVLNGEMVEVSTGLFTDNEHVDGMWKKTPYTSIARNYRPDHLAILPDQKGACSIADGAGLNRNAKQGNLPATQGAPNMGNKATQNRRTVTAPTTEELVESLITNGHYDEEDREDLANLNPELLGRIVANAATGDTITDGKNADGGEELKNAKGKLAPKKAPAYGKGTDNGDAAANDIMKNKPKRTAKMEEEDEDNAKPTGNMSVEDFIAGAPPAVGALIANALRHEAKQKQELVNRIVANKANRFTKDYLLTQDVEVLEGIAAFATNAAPAVTRRQSVLTGNYGGQGDAEQVVTNIGMTDEEPLEPLTLNFEQGEAKPTRRGR